MRPHVLGLLERVRSHSQLLLILGVLEGISAELLLVHDGQIDQILLRSLAPSGHLRL